MHLGVIEIFTRDKLGLSKLPESLPTVLSSFLAFTFVHQVVSPILSTGLAPVSYRAITNKNTWGMHFASQCHVLLIVPLAFWCVVAQAGSPDWNSHQDKAFGWDDRVGFVSSIACGYFLWDSLDAAINFIDASFVIHGVACLIFYTSSFRPFASYYAVRFLLWEASTFFLNIHWFLDKTNHTGSTLQLVNGVFLIASFFCVRIIYGGWTSYSFIVTLRHVYSDVLFFYTCMYAVGICLLQGLNWFWLMKMIDALRKRFKGQKLGGSAKFNNITMNGARNE